MAKDEGSPTERGLREVSVEVALISHRGGNGFGPENTLEALEEALERGVTAIETDVQQAGDGTLVIHHDGEVDGLPIRQTPFRKLRALHPEIPSLDEYLELAGGRCFLNLEVKWAEPKALAERLGVLDPDRILVTSFNRDILRGLREAAPELPLGLLPDNIIHNSGAAEEAAAQGFLAILPFELLATRHLVAEAHRHGLRVVAWTVNRTLMLERLLENGIDGIITDRYPVMRDFLLARGIRPVDNPLAVPLVRGGSEPGGDP